jgi:LPS-assembly protein
MERARGVYIVRFYSLAAALAATTALSPFASLAASGATFRVEQQPNMFPRTSFSEKPVVTPEEPVLLEASHIDYQQNGLVIATGQVAVTQGETILLADSLAYDQTADLVIAQGNVSVLDPSGNVYFADAVELKKDMKTGVVRQFKARFNDNSLIAAVQGRKIDEHRIDLTKAIYSPCNCTDEKTKKPVRPQWAITASHALIDDEAQTVTYNDVSFDVYGVPIFYSPYLSHATPGAENKSGFLMPEYRHNQNIGSMIKVPFYYAIAPNRDATITPILTSEEGLVMGGEYREQFDSGFLLFDGSLTNPESRDAAGNTTSGHDVRGHLNAEGKFDIAPGYDWGFSIHRATDDTYLRRYGWSTEPLLTSKVYAEGFNLIEDNNRSYASVTGLAFQGLTAADNRDKIPLVVPLAEFAYESQPGDYHSRFTVDSNLMSLTRELGSESRRLSTTLGWNLPYITQDGQVIDLRAQLRSDAYSVDDVLLTNGKNFNGTTGRMVPQVSALWRYPFINRWEDHSLLIEPVAMLAVSPNGGNPEKIPNEDSLAPEFTDTNLFDPNRFAGYDRIESGTRASYGLRGQAQLFHDKYIDWLFGQNYRVANDRNFPFTNDLVSHFSDYVGKVGIAYNPLSLAYRFRLDKHGWEPKRQEVDLGYMLSPVGFSLSYLSLKNDPILANKEIITGSASVNLTKRWTWVIGGSEDLELNQVTGAMTGLIYQNECTNVSGIMLRDFTRDRDIVPSTTFLFRISLKNLE